MNLDDAIAKCISFGATLFVPQNTFELHEYAEYMVDTGLDHSWLGLKDTYDDHRKVEYINGKFQSWVGQPVLWFIGKIVS